MGSAGFRNTIDRVELVGAESMSEVQQESSALRRCSGLLFQVRLSPSPVVELGKVSKARSSHSCKLVSHKPPLSDSDLIRYQTHEATYVAGR